MKELWDKRYSQTDFFYGKSANEFLVNNVEALEKGRVLCLAEGEGRNAVYLASLGFDVAAVDSSEVGLNKALLFAAENKVQITADVADLADYDLGENQYSAVVSIFCHLPPALRQSVHARAIRALQPGGKLLLEAYSPQQLALKTGGPSKAALLYSEETIKQDFIGLSTLFINERERNVQEGAGHSGVGHVVQYIGQKPK